MDNEKLIALRVFLNFKFETKITDDDLLEFENPYLLLHGDNFNFQSRKLTKEKLSQFETKIPKGIYNQKVVDYLTKEIESDVANANKQIDRMIHSPESYNIIWLEKLIKDLILPFDVLLYQSYRYFYMRSQATSKFYAGHPIDKLMKEKWDRIVSS